jgi:hypothetical protein
VVYTATLSVSDATGTVLFEDGDAPIAGCGERAISLGSATCAVTSYGTAGEHTITAIYSGDGNYIGSTSSPLDQVVSRANTSTTLASSVNPAMVGQPVTYTARVSPAAATGTVEFKESGSTITSCVAQTTNLGTATCTLSGYATAGSHSITATYVGDGGYLSSTSRGLSQVVNKVGTTATSTTVSSSLNPSTVGEAVTYTAALNTTAATGTVEFKQAGATIAGCAAQPVASGTATCAVADLAAGGHLIKAIYYGDSIYRGSSSPGLTQVVNTISTTTAVSSSLNPSTAGEAVTYTAALNATAATGAIEFREDGAVIPGCTAQPTNSGNATCTVTDPTAGSHQITAVYSGDSNYAPSWSSALTQTVSKKTTTTTVSSSPNPSLVGQAVTFTATVNAAAATGTVEFKQAGVTISGCATQAVSAGAATCTLANLAAGRPWITAVYSGDSNYAPSWSPALTQTVNKKPTTTTVLSSSNPSTVGQTVTYTATVSPAAATGTIEFQEEGTPITGCTAEIVSSGAARCTVTGYSKWSSYGIVAAYSGDSSYLASTSSMFTQTVEPPVDSAGPFRFFSPSSFWNEQLPADAPLDPNSNAIVDAFDKEIETEEEANNGPAINTTTSSIPVYTVSAEQPLVQVTLENPSQAPGGSALQSAWDAVPLPANAKPSVGTDKHLVVWQPSTDRLWEFWRLEQTAEGWQASWGGAIRNVSSDPGAYGPEAWPGAMYDWGASASSLSVAGGLITLEDLEMGQINHALAIAVPDTRAGEYASPAQRTDGTSTSQLSLPEGAHLRLDPSLDLATLHLPKLTLMMAEAAQRYGIFVRDKGPNVSFYAQDPTPTGTNPYSGPHGYFEGKTTTQQILASFPWSHLQLLKMELHSNS